MILWSSREVPPVMLFQILSKLACPVFLRSENIFGGSGRCSRLRFFVHLETGYQIRVRSSEVLLSVFGVEDACAGRGLCFSVLFPKSRLLRFLV